MRNRNHKAFTLIELLVVISIIGLLAAILLPAMRSAKDMARRVACASTLRQVGVGLVSYLANNKDKLPYASLMPSVSPAPLLQDRPIYISYVLRSTTGKDPEVFHCPNDQTGAARPAPNMGKSYFESELSSYEYRVMFAGSTIDQIVGRFERFGLNTTENSIWVMRDYDNFHGEGGKPGARRYLYLDGHVADFEN